MESFGSFFDEEWESLSKMFSGDQDTDHFSSHGLFSSEQDHGLNLETPSNVSSVMTGQSNNANSSLMDDNGFSYAYENINPNFYHYFSQENSNNAASLPYPSSNVTPLPTNGACDHEPVNIYDHENNINSLLLSQVLSEYSMEEILCSRQDINIENSIDPTEPISDQLKHTPLKRKIEMAESQDTLEDKVNDEKPVEKPKKKTRVSKDNKNNKKKVQPKKKQKVIDSIENGNENDGEDNNNDKVGNAPIASSSSCSSEDDLNGVAENSNWKTRAGRGAATDPQSLYARKRRERINERLKVLQNLVPNGTKVDISTMLEEAVQYVKFLQLQIKLLSSDEMWMYAPIAYNGMDMGLYQKLSHS